MGSSPTEAKYSTSEGGEEDREVGVPGPLKLAEPGLLHLTLLSLYFFYYFHLRVTP
jgi:hypothetical protein